MKKIIAKLVMACAANGAIAQSMLVSIVEMNNSNNALPEFTVKSVQAKDAPLIQLSAPNITEPVSSPTAIDLRFQATAPSTVNPDSFRVLYGSFEIDITKRLLNVAKVSAQGVIVNEASLPKGKHKLLMVVEDSEGRKGSQTVNFEVK